MEKVKKPRKKRKKRKEDREARPVERQDREWDCERDPLTHADDAAAHAHAHAVSSWVHDAAKLASPSWSCRRHESVTASCYRWWDPRETHLPPPSPVARSTQPSFVAPAFTVHRYLLLSFPSKPNKMFVTLWSKNLRFIESRNCASVVRPCRLVVFHVCVFYDCVMNYESVMTLCCCCLWFFFFFFWLFGFVTLSLYVCDSLFVYIDKRDR